MKQKKVQPERVRKFYCSNKNCKELLMKVYPYALPTHNLTINCGACYNRLVAGQK